MTMANFTLISTCVDNEINQASSLLPASTPENSISYNLVADSEYSDRDIIVINVAGKRFEVSAAAPSMNFISFFLKCKA